MSDEAVDREELASLVADLRERGRYYAGLTSIGFAPSAKPEASGAPGKPAASLSSPKAAAAPPTAPGGEGLVAIREDIGDCRRCKLSSRRKTIVFGQGNPHAKLMFVGEAPGADEDEQGLAFVGKAGQLLTRIIEAIGMTREDVYIANVIKCRPPENRNPEPDEILACQGFLDRQIAAIKPEVIVGLGKFAGQYLLQTAEPISKIRGKLGEYKGVKVMPTWHPAYLLRTPSAKKDVWEDMKVVRAMLSSPE